MSEPFERHEVPVEGDASIVARLFRPATGGPAHRGTVLLVPAMGAPQTYYAPLAGWLAGEGFVAVTFDYRGIGLSRPEAYRRSLRGFEMHLLDWARGDCRAMIEFARTSAPGLPLTWLGHSLGGQILPFVPNRQAVDRMVTVAAGSGYWRENAPALRRFAGLLWFGIVPAALALWGYFPGKRLRMVGDLPRGVMADWRRWCLDAEYAVGAEGEAARQIYAETDLPIVSLSFTDDEFMSEQNTASLHGFYVNAPRTMRRWAPAELGLRRVGHFGFFRAEMAEPLWRRELLPELARR